MSGNLNFDEKWRNAASKVGFIKPKPKPQVQKRKPKLTELFGKSKEKNEKLPTLYESYRPDPKLKSALKKTSSFGPQSEKPKQLTAEQLTPQRLIPKRPEKNSKKSKFEGCSYSPSGGPRFMGGPTPPWFSWGQGNVVGVRTSHEKMDVCFSWGGPTPP